MRLLPQFLTKLKEEDAGAKLFTFIKARVPLFREYIDFEFSPAPGATGLDFADFGEDVETLRSQDFPYNTPNEDVLRIVYEVILKPAFQIYDASGWQARGMTLGNVEWSKFKLIPKEMQSDVKF